MLPLENFVSFLVSPPPLPPPLTFAPSSDGGRAGRLELASGVGPGRGSDTAWIFSNPGIEAI